MGCCDSSQVSSKSTCYETYQPYLNKIAEYIKKCVPNSKLAIHQTWAYEQDSQRLNDIGYTNHTEMFADIEKSYQKAAEDINTDIIIPSGEVFQKLIASGIEKVHRDTFHAGYGLGRYALGLLWYAMLSENDIKRNAFADFDEQISETEIKIVKQCVEEICTLHSSK